MNQRTRLTKLMFRKALAQLMKDKHISQISIREICEKAELNRSTFYLHYKIRFLKYLRENKDYYHILLTSNDFNFMRKYHERILDKLMKIMNLGVSENRQKYILSYALEGSMCVVRKWAENGFYESPEEIGEILQKLSESIVSGVSTSLSE